MHRGSVKSCGPPQQKRFRPLEGLTTPGSIMLSLAGVLEGGARSLGFWKAELYIAGQIGPNSAISAPL